MADRPGTLEHEPRKDSNHTTVILRSLTLAFALAAWPLQAQGPDPRVVRADLARIAGKADAKAWILIVSDFQCPYCKEYHQTTGKQVLREFVESGKARLAYIQFPLRQHQHAFPAAEASMCAGAQDRFWPYHDKLFETVEQWGAANNPVPMFDSIAGEVGINLAWFRKCMADRIMQAMIQADVERARKAGANSTPTFIIGKAVIPGNAPIAVIRKAVNEALGAK